MRVHIVDPSAFTPPYDHALCVALARAGADVELITSRFAYGAVAEPEGYVVRERFYRRAPGAAGSRLPGERPLPGGRVWVEGAVVLFSGLLRPYKGIGVLPEAGGGSAAAELWMGGSPRMPLEPIRRLAGPNVRLVPRFVPDAELPAY